MLPSRGYKQQIHDRTVFFYFYTKSLSGVHDSGCYPTPYRRASDDANRSSSWNRDPVSEDYRSSNFAHADDHSLRESRLPCGNGASQKKSRDHDGERKVDLEKSPASALDLRSEVAAASAMLQLSSSVDEKKTSKSSSPRRSSDESPKKTTSSRSSGLGHPQVTPLPPYKQHYKWKYSDVSYILSSAATKQIADVSTYDVTAILYKANDVIFSIAQ